MQAPHDIWRRFHDPLQAFVRRRVNDDAAVEDIVQDVFMRIHARIDQLKGTDRLQSWVYQIARNAIVDHYRVMGRLRERKDKVLVEPQELAPQMDATAAEELSQCVKPLLATLPQEYQHAVIWTELDGLTQKQAAERAGITLSGMKSRVQRGRQKLLEKLLDCCHLEFDRRNVPSDYRPKNCTSCNR